MIIGNYTNIQEPCELDLWLSDPEINRGNLLVTINQYVKYEDFVIKSFQDNKRKSFWHLRLTFTFELATQNQWPITMWNMKILW
jgi:hypothetical protein